MNMTDNFIQSSGVDMNAQAGEGLSWSIQDLPGRRTWRHDVSLKQIQIQNECSSHKKRSSQGRVDKKSRLL